MTMVQKQPIVVMGGGPAGVFTACGLVDLGFEVILITRPRPFPAWEGLSERPVRSLSHFGFKTTLASIGPKVARQVHWNGKFQIQNQEYILNRQLFDQALLRDASDKGVTVIKSRVDKVVRANGGWDIVYGQETLHTGFLVEARGRESRLGRKLMTGDDDYTTAPATSALLKSYVVSPDLPAMTSVASFPMGWAWYLRDGNGTAIVQLFVSSEKGEVPPKDSLDGYFLQLIAELPEAEEWLQGASVHDVHVSVRTAAATKVTPVGGDDFLVVGDGSLALDPLSGNGIFYAIGSGLSAAPVINTLIKNPENKNLALQFYQERIDLAFEGGCLMGKEFYASEERWKDAPYWKARSSWPISEAISHPDPLSIPPEIYKKPVVKEGFITEEDLIVTADHPRGIWTIDSVPLVELRDLIMAGGDDQDHAKELGRDIKSVTSARKWLTARKIIDEGIKSQNKIT